MSPYNLSIRDRRLLVRLASDALDRLEERFNDEFDDPITQAYSGASEVVSHAHRKAKLQTLAKFGLDCEEALCWVKESCR